MRKRAGITNCLASGYSSGHGNAKLTRSIGDAVSPTSRHYAD